MFSIFKKKAAEAFNKIHKVENKDLMEAIVAASILVAYADGDCSDTELEKLQSIIETNDSLKHFGADIGKTIDKYSAMYEAGARLAKVKLKKEISDVSFSDTEKEEAFVIAVEIAGADGEFSDDEMKILNEIGRIYGLKPENYI